MTYTPIERGTTDWDVPVNAAFASQDALITANTSDIANIENAEAPRPTELGFFAWSFDPAHIAGQSGITSGTVHMVRIDLKTSAMVSNVVMGSQSAGTSLNAGQCFAGLYDASGNRIGVTADQSVAWGSSGLYVMPLTVPVSLSPGSYHVAILGNGSGLPQMGRTFGAVGIAPVANAGTTVTDARWGNGPTGQTSLPTSVAMNTRTYGASGFWAALS